MTQLGDFHVKEPVGSSESDQARKRMVAAAVVVLLLCAFGAYWFFGRSVEEPAVETVVEVPPEPTPPPPPPAPSPDPEPVELPALDESDAFIRDLVGTVSSHPNVVAWLATDRIIRRFVVATDNVADGANPAQHVTDLRPDARFATVGSGDTLRVDPRSYQRYDLHAQIIASLDTQGVADLYHQLEPLMNAAYVELGNPDRPFIQTVERATVSLLSVPIVTEPPALVEHAPFFHYVDERLEDLTPAQKQFLGMGPDNVRMVQAKVRQIALAIGIPDSRLP